MPGSVEKTLSLAVIVVACAGAGAAVAQEDGKPVSVLNPDGKDACYGRVYNDAHLVRHRRQKVARIFLLSGDDPRNAPTEEPERGAPVSHSSAYLITTFRGDAKPGWVWASCDSESGMEKNSIRCSQECSRTLGTVAADGHGGIILSDLDRYLYLNPQDADTERTASQKAQDLARTLGEDDTRFRLDPLPLEACRAEFRKIDQVDPALGEPLRIRLKADQPFCYGRDYDAGHLSRHPG